MSSGRNSLPSTSTGRPLWSFLRNVPKDVRLCCGQVNRGVALLGDQVFVGTVDAHLIALNRKTGLLREAQRASVGQSASKLLTTAELRAASATWPTRFADLIADADVFAKGVTWAQRYDTTFSTAATGSTTWNWVRMLTRIATLSASPMP